MSDSVRPHPWDSPGKNTGVGCHFLPQCIKVKSESEVAQLCLSLCDPMDCNLPGSSIHGIFQARVLESGAIAFSELYFPLKQARPSAYAEFPKTPMSFQCLIFQLKENNGIFSAVHASLYGMSLGSSLVHIYWDYVFTFFSIIFAQEIFLCTYNEQSTENSNWGDVVIIKSKCLFVCF